MPTEILRPNAAGDLTQIWNQTPFSGAHWDKVADIIPDEDTTRVWMAPYNDATRSDLYRLETLTGLASIEKLTFYTRVRGRGYHLGVLPHSIIFKTHGSIYTLDYSSTPSGWTTFSWSLGNNPFTGVPWTLEELTTLQAGVSLSARYGYLQDASGYCTQVYVEVDYPAFIPTVSADPATDVAANSATINGALDNDGGEACDCGFEWGKTVAYGNTTPTQSKETGQTFSQAISGLDPDTTYHFRAFARNAAGTSYSADRTFTTLGVTSSVTTDPATGVGMVVADLNGTLDDDGGEACDCGFQWGKTVAYGNTTPTQSKVTAYHFRAFARNAAGTSYGDDRTFTVGQTFSQAINGLIPGTTYHFRAFSTNVAGRNYGGDRTFTTKEARSRGYALSRHEL